MNPPFSLPLPAPPLDAAPPPRSRAEPEPRPDPELPPAAEAAPAGAAYVVRCRLVSGDAVEIATAGDLAGAQSIARAAMEACLRPYGTEWPIVGGRYVRPEAIISIEVAERE